MLGGREAGAGFPPSEKFFRKWLCEKREDTISKFSAIYRNIQVIYQGKIVIVWRRESLYEPALSVARNRNI